MGVGSVLCEGVAQGTGVHGMMECMRTFRRY